MKEKIKLIYRIINSTISTLLDDSAKDLTKVERSLGKLDIVLGELGLIVDALEEESNTDDPRIPELIKRVTALEDEVGDRYDEHG